MQQPGLSHYSGFVESSPPLNTANDHCRVLLVDDNPDDQTEARKRLLKSDRVEDIVFFNDGTELIKYLYDQGFHDRSAWSLTPMVIVLDLNMPRMNGFDVLAELKADSFLRDIPVIVVTGSESAEDLKRAFSPESGRHLPQAARRRQAGVFFQVRLELAASGYVDVLTGIGGASSSRRSVK